jgi:hypothetical protein
VLQTVLWDKAAPSERSSSERPCRLDRGPDGNRLGPLQPPAQGATEYELQDERLTRLALRRSSSPALTGGAAVGHTRSRWLLACVPARGLVTLTPMLVVGFGLAGFILVLLVIGLNLSRARARQIAEAPPMPG